MVTHAHGDHARAGMGEYHATAASLPLLRWRLGEQRYQPHEDRQPFALGACELSLHPAGHVLGSAQVRIAAADQVWVVSGDYKRDADPSCAAFEVQPCDGFVTEATFALPVYRWPSPSLVAAEILQWWYACRADGLTAVLFCYALGKAQRVLAELATLLPPEQHAAHQVLLHGAMLRPVEIYRAAGVVMLPTAGLIEQSGREEAAPASAALVLAPPSTAGSPWMRRFRRLSTGFVSGWMKLRGNRRRRGYERGFVMSDHADWPALLRTVEETGAREVLATHGHADALVQVLRERGIDAGTLRTEYGDDAED